MTKYFSRGKVLVGTTMLAAALICGCGNSENFVFTNPIVQPPINPNQAPIAQNDSFQALGNATVNQAASGVLANDTLNGATIESFQATGSQGGTIDLNADGSFSYTPATGFVGTETFTYTLENEIGTSTATVTMTSTGFGRFVNNAAAPGGTGTQVSPFDTLAAAVAIAQPGDIIYVARGNGTNSGMTGGFTLPQGVSLIGEGTGLILGQTVEQPGTAPTLEGPIDCQGNNLIQGVTIEGGSAELVQIDTVANVTINECTLANPAAGQEHIIVDDVTGTFAVTNCTFRIDPGNDGDDFIYVDNADSSVSVVVTDNTFSNEADDDFDTVVELYGEGTMNIDATISRNNFNGTVGGELHYGIYFECEDEPNVNATITCEDNVFSNHENEVITVYDVTGVISGNTITNAAGEEAIYASIADGTLTVTGNMISNVQDGFYGYYNNGAGTYVLSNNNFSNCSEYGIEIEEDEDNNAKFAARNNTITNSGIHSIDVDWDTPPGFDICCDIIGNTVDDDMEFDDDDDGDIIVERFGNASGDELQTVNTFNGGATVVVSGGAIVDAIAGFCAIP